MIFRYVQWDRVDDFLKLGWMIGKPASEWSCFMWACECNPEGKKIPVKERAA